MDAQPLNLPLVRSLVTDFIYRQITRAGFQRAVIGLSGGLDSALACVLAAEALGAQNVLAVRMPYRTSSPESLEHAQMVIDWLGVPALTLPITEMVDPYLERFPGISDLRRGNIMARQRMVVLFDQSAAFNGLVVGTGNKTEILLGYSTLYGDSACAFLPLGDLYKTQVRQLAREMGVPAVIIEKPPSADLWANQTDEGELGFTYAEVDRLLFLLIDQQLTPAECVLAGFDKGFVQTVVGRVQRSHFKRVLPPVAKVNT
jgi:NAD+ synthase